MSHYRLHGINGLRPKRSAHIAQFKLRVLAHQDRERLSCCRRQSSMRMLKRIHKNARLFVSGLHVRREHINDMLQNCKHPVTPS